MPRKAAKCGQLESRSGSSAGGRESGYGIWRIVETYNRHNLILDLLRQRDDLQEQSKVDLAWFRTQTSRLQTKGVPYRSQEHRNANGLLSTRHLAGFVAVAELSECLWSGGSG